MKWNAVTSFDEGQTFEALFTNVNMYMSAMFAVLIFAIIISYLFGREYNEHTLKTMLTIPVSRAKFLASKYVMFCLLKSKNSSQIYVKPFRKQTKK